MFYSDRQDGIPGPAGVVRACGRARPTGRRRRSTSPGSRVAWPGPTRAWAARGGARLPGGEPRPRQPALGDGPRTSPTRHEVTPEQNGAMYRSLDRHLAAAGVREQIRFMGRILVADQPARLVPVHGVAPGGSAETRTRCTSTGATGTRPRSSDGSADVRPSFGDLPENGRKPVFVSEYGVRGRRRPKVPAPGVYADGTPLARRIAAFQHACVPDRGDAARLRPAWSSGTATPASMPTTETSVCAIGPWQRRWPLYPSLPAYCGS